VSAQNKSSNKDGFQDRILELPPLYLDLKMEKQGIPSTYVQGKGAEYA